MIDVSAIRKDTRWHFLGREVVVTEVTAQFVIFHPLNRPPEVVVLEKFAAGAKDPATAEYADLLDELTGGGTSGLTVTNALIYLLERLGPPAPLNVVPPAPAPEKPDPVALPAEPDTEVEDYAVTEPTDECAVEVEVKPRRLAGTRNPNRWV